MVIFFLLGYSQLIIVIYLPTYNKNYTYYTYVIVAMDNFGLLLFFLKKKKKNLI